MLHYYCIYSSSLCRFSKSDTKLNNFWFSFRSTILKIIEHKIFEGVIIACIIGSSIILAFDDAYCKYGSLTKTIIEDMDYCFQVVFLIEMLLKWIGYGIKKYFTDWWCLLDFCIVMVNMFVNV